MALLSPSFFGMQKDVKRYPTYEVQEGATWGLDRIDQMSLPLNSEYRFDGNGGTNVIGTLEPHGHVSFCIPYCMRRLS